MAEDLQVILGEVMTTATIMFPHKPTPNKGILPQHLWPKSVRHDIFNIWRRAKAIRHLIHLTDWPSDATQTARNVDTTLSLWSSVNTPIPICTVLSQSLEGLDKLSLLTR